MATSSKDFSILVDSSRASILTNESRLSTVEIFLQNKQLSDTIDVVVHRSGVKLNLPPNNRVFSSESLVLPEPSVEYFACENVQV